MTTTTPPELEASGPPPRRLRNPKLYLSVALMLLMACVAVAFVSVVWERNDTRTELAAARSDLREAKTALTQSDRETDCRARLANTVADRQADTILAIGDLAVALYLKDKPGAQEAAVKFRAFAVAYEAAVEARGDSVTKCKGS